METPKRLKKLPTNRVQPEPQMVEKKPFGISIEFFWTIFSAIIAASFFLGLYIGQAKFDKEKTDYYEKMKSLILENTTFKTNNDSLLNLTNNLIRTKSLKQGKLISIQNNDNRVWEIRQMSIVYKNRQDSLMTLDKEVEMRVRPGEKLNLEGKFIDWDNSCLFYSFRLFSIKYDNLWTGSYGEDMVNGNLIIKQITE